LKPVTAINENNEIGQGNFNESISKKFAEELAIILYHRK
jgi:hypothetical protein